ncbi:hypothetical protein F1880_007527 [Penicillium rolfsii]|nr:hypothetical protein F1880_007527 [Penicillium rolfsii]
MKTVLWASFFGVGALAHPSGLWWGTDQCFPSPENTDNQCLEPQKAGFDWSELADGDNWSYEGFNFVGFSPNNACGDSGGKCIQAKLSRDDDYAIRVEATQAPFSVSNLHLTTSRDTLVILNYQMADGSTCRQLAWGSTNGTDVTNEQCGSAVAVEFTLPEDSKFGECDMSIHRMDFDCSGGPKPPTEMPPHSSTTDVEWTTTPPATSTVWTHPTPTTPATETTPESSWETTWQTTCDTTLETTPATTWETTTATTWETTPVPTERTTWTTTEWTTSEWTTSTIWTTEEITITSCAPTVTNCPAHSTSVITSTYVASTTVCPIQPTDQTTEVPPSHPTKTETKTETSPAVPSTSVVPAPCPQLVPKCLNTWLSVPKCESNSDAACFCPSSEFTEKVTTCIYSWGRSEEEVDSSLSYFAGICAPYVPKNPEIIDIVPPSHTTPADVPHAPHHTMTAPGPGMTAPSGEVPPMVTQPSGDVPSEVTQAPTAPKTPCTTMTWSSRTVTAPLVEFSTIHVGHSSTVALVPGTHTDSHPKTTHRTCSTTTTSTSSFTTSTSSKTTTCTTHAHKPTATIPLSNGGSRTRCDEEQPCRNCRQAGVDCITTDKRRAGALVSNRRRTVAAESPSQQAIPRTPDSHLSTATPSASQDRPRLWSQCWGREGWKTGRLPLMPRFVGASTVELMTEWLDMAFYRLKGAKTHALSPLVNQNFAADIPERAPQLPLSTEMETCINNFSDTLGQLFPFLDQSIVESSFAIETLTSTMHSTKASGVHQRALVYLMVTAGMMAMPASEGSPSLISSYIAYCNSLLGHIVATRCLKSVQAILLFAMVLRSCDKIAWAWDVLTMGVSMAQSLGINQVRSPSSTPTGSDSLEFRTWWSMYVFEKILAFELGRPSMVWDRDLSGTLATSVQVEVQYDTNQLFWQASISLANMLHELQERSAKAWRREAWLPQTVEQAIEEKLQTGIDLLTLLSEWLQNLPDDLKSTAMHGSCNGARSAFLAYYYNLGVILVHRSTLLVDPNELREVVERFAPDKPWRQRLLSGPSLATESAREMIKLFVPLVDSGIPNYLTLMTSPLPAVYALAVSIVREQKSLLVRSDFELMKAGIQISRQYYKKHGTALNFDEILRDLEEYISHLLEDPMPNRLELTSLSSANPILNHNLVDDSIPFTSLATQWGPSALDWGGWDWNDLSHLFQHSE